MDAATNAPFDPTSLVDDVRRSPPILPHAVSAQPLCTPFLTSAPLSPSHFRSPPPGRAAAIDRHGLSPAARHPRTDHNRVKHCASFAQIVSTTSPRLSHLFPSFSPPSSRASSPSNNVDGALNWLLQHSGDASLDRPITPPPQYGPVDPSGSDDSQACVPFSPARHPPHRPIEGRFGNFHPNAVVRLSGARVPRNCGCPLAPGC